jgi:tRNA pseudouridine38-40 synthase
MERVTYRLLVEYDGTDFHGWQFQPGLRTAQGELEGALAVLAGEAVRVAGAGRTDAGCHARGQVASFSTRRRLEPRRLLGSLAGLLPADLAVRAAAPAPDGFHARRGVLERAYTYRLLTRPSPLWRRTAWYPGFAPEGEALEAVTRPLVGTHDLRGFAGADPARQGADGMCRVARATWRPWEGGWVFEIVANRFLYHMVRNIVGTAVKVARGHLRPERARRALAEADRRLAGPTAPPQGVCLESVVYASEATAAALASWEAETARGLAP